ncbi:hypothetical protein, partial [Almyronema epifaneia]
DLSGFGTETSQPLSETLLEPSTASPIVETNGWVRNSAGQVELVTATSTSRFPGAVANYATCSAASIPPPSP